MYRQIKERINRCGIDQEEAPDVVNLCYDAEMKEDLILRVSDRLFKPFLDAYQPRQSSAQDSEPKLVPRFLSKKKRIPEIMLCLSNGLSST